MTDLPTLYQQMADLTKPECASSCRIPHSCCSPEYCQMAREVAKEWGVELDETDHPTLPFMGDNGCVVAPHLRPMCTIHTCDIGAFGCKFHPSPDPEWDEKYFRLREKIEVGEIQRMDRTPATSPSTTTGDTK